MRNSHTEKRTTTVTTSTKIGTETISRTSQSVSIGSACVDAAAGNQSIAAPSAMPIADAISADDDHLGEMALPVARLRALIARGLARISSGHGGGILWRRAATEREPVARRPSAPTGARRRRTAPRRLGGLRGRARAAR